MLREKVLKLVKHQIEKRHKAPLKLRPTRSTKDLKASRLDAGQVYKCFRFTGIYLDSHSCYSGNILHFRNMGTALTHNRATLVVIEEFEIKFNIGCMVEIAPVSKSHQQMERKLKGATFKIFREVPLFYFLFDNSLITFTYNQTF